MKFFQKTSKMLLILCGIFLFAVSPISVSAAPKKVSGIKCGVTTQNSINISWSGQNGISGYQIYRSSCYEGEYKRIMNVNPQMRAFCNKNLPSGQEYYYKIRAYSNNRGHTTYGKCSKILKGYTKMPYTQKAKVRARVNMRKHAGTTHPVLATLNTNTTVSILCSAKDKTGGDWKYVKCTANGQSLKGYIRSDLLGKANGNNNNTVKKTAKVTANSLNVRSNAGMNSPVISNLKKGQTVTVLGVKKSADGTSWTQVQFKKNGRTVKGYVASRYLRVL